MPSKKQKTQTTTDQSIEDNRVIAGGAGIGKIQLASNAAINYVNEFSADVGAAFAQLIDLSRDAGAVAFDATQAAIKSSEQTVEILAETQTGTASIRKFLPYAIIAGMAIVILGIFGKRKK